MPFESAEPSPIWPPPGARLVSFAPGWRATRSTTPRERQRVYVITIVLGVVHEYLKPYPCRLQGIAWTAARRGPTPARVARSPTSRSRALPSRLRMRSGLRRTTSDVASTCLASARHVRVVLVKFAEAVSAALGDDAELNEAVKHFE